MNVFQLAENALPHDADIQKYVDLAQESDKQALVGKEIDLDLIVEVLKTPRPTGRVPEVMSGQLAFISDFFHKSNGVPTWSSMLQAQVANKWGLPFPIEKGGTQAQRISLINHLTNKRLENLSDDQYNEFRKQIFVPKTKDEEVECSSSDEEPPVASRLRRKDGHWGMSGKELFELGILKP